MNRLLNFSLLATYIYAFICRTGLGVNAMNTDPSQAVHARIWTAQDVETLTRYLLTNQCRYRKSDLADMAKSMKRTLASVQGKAKKLRPEIGCRAVGRHWYLPSAMESLAAQMDAEKMDIDDDVEEESEEDETASGSDDDSYRPRAQAKDEKKRPRDNVTQSEAGKRKRVDPTTFMRRFIILNECTYTREQVCDFSDQLQRSYLTVSKKLSALRQTMCVKVMGQRNLWTLLPGISEESSEDFQERKLSVEMANNDEVVDDTPNAPSSVWTVEMESKFVDFLFKNNCKVTKSDLRHLALEFDRSVTSLERRSLRLKLKYCTRIKKGEWILASNAPPPPPPLQSKGPSTVRALTSTSVIHSWTPAELERLGNFVVDHNCNPTLYQMAELAREMGRPANGVEKKATRQKLLLCEVDDLGIWRVRSATLRIVAEPEVVPGTSRASAPSLSAEDDLKLLRGLSRLGTERGVRSEQKASMSTLVPKIRDAGGPSAHRPGSSSIEAARSATREARAKELKNRSSAAMKSTEQTNRRPIPHAAPPLQTAVARPSGPVIQPLDLDELF